MNLLKAILSRGESRCWYRDFWAMRKTAWPRSLLFVTHILHMPTCFSVLGNETRVCLSIVCLFLCLSVSLCPLSHFCSCDSVALYTPDWYQTPGLKWMPYLCDWKLGYVAIFPFNRHIITTHVYKAQHGVLIHICCAMINYSDHYRKEQSTKSKQRPVLAAFLVAMPNTS